MSWSTALKGTLAGTLSPAAKVAQLMTPLARAWNLARLRSHLRHPIPADNVLLGVVEVHGTGEIHLGRGLYLYRELYLETQEHGSIRIGDRVVISRGTHIVSFERVELADDVMVGEYVSIRDANHRIGTDSNVRDSGHDSAPIRVERNAWIGRGAVLLPGVTIGPGAVVGANSVVTRDVPAGAVVVGAPAKPLPGRATLSTEGNSGAAT